MIDVATVTDYDHFLEWPDTDPALRGLQSSYEMSTVSRHKFLNLGTLQSHELKHAHKHSYLVKQVIYRLI